MATKSISQLDSASTMALGDLLEIAEPNAQSVSGYTSKKISIGSQLAPYIQGTVQNASLNTTNKTLVGAINEVDSEGVKWSEYNFLGAKNMLNTKGMERTNLSITSVLNDDGTITSNGTANNGGQLFTYNNCILPDLKVGDVVTFSIEVFSGSYTHGASASLTRIYLVDATGNTLNGTVIEMGSSMATGDKKEVDYTITSDCFKNGVCTLWGAQCYVRSGDIFSDFNIGIMLRLKAVSDDTFEPYSQTNSEIAKRKASITELEKVYQNDYNLLHQPYYDENQKKTVSRSVYFDINGSEVKASGTATGGNATYILRSWMDGFLPNKNEVYHLDGCPSGGTSNSYYLVVQFVDSNGTTLGYVYDYGNGVDFVIPSDCAGLGVIFYVRTNYAITGTLTIKPRLTVSNKFSSSEVGTIENGTNASQAYTIGDYMIWKRRFYKVTAAISAGGAITEGTNVTKTTIGAELKAALNA